MNTKVKICGIKSIETLELLTELQVDYVGFVFADSRRRIGSEEAADLLNAVPVHPPAVGVFVNPTLEELERIVAAVPLDVIQLHGQETPAFCREAAGRFAKRIWKAIPIGEDGPLAMQVESYWPHVEAFLFDTHDPRQAGGTGKRFRWEQIPGLLQRAGEATPVIAGGITPENVEELVTRYRPPMIDVSSGVETNGQKDAEKIKELMKRVRRHDQYDIHTGNRS
ncbi:phosphoribosylanthranilate isomerase [Brevibacillus sp. SYP-B805]|uniref:phosphoribosylanthranilate isomerase n=1 Tax=Brevibacillus sp. SYP-B805 TaxID=1578199 RepID=UPI0013E9CAE6|nr:phosphoribosylanthranilate isomerase [Brevibacillus sp. SYP-B805]NGQ94562.1 phosphoribosylanthranilate isomerase [Brevibacillus sp. SYP-B805]